MVWPVPPQGGAAAADKEATLLALASSSYGNGRTIVFFRTKVASLLPHVFSLVLSKE